MTMSNAKSTMTCGCPVTAFQKMISGKYKLRIIWDLKAIPVAVRENPSRRLRARG